MAERTRQCPRSVHLVFDPEEEKPVRREVDWDAWEKNRLTGWNRWWLLLMVLMMAAMVGLWMKSGGTMVPGAPPR